MGSALLGPGFEVLVLGFRVLKLGFAVLVPRKPQEAPGGPRKPQEAPGCPRRPRKPQEAPGSPKEPQEVLGSPRKPQQAPGGTRKPQEALESHFGHIFEPKLENSPRKLLKGEPFRTHFRALAGKWPKDGPEHLNYEVSGPVVQNVVNYEALDNSGPKTS